MAVAIKKIGKGRFGFAQLQNPAQLGLLDGNQGRTLPLGRMGEEAKDQLIGRKPSEAVVLHQLQGNFLMQGVKWLDASALVEHPERTEPGSQLRIGSRRQVG